MSKQENTFETPKVKCFKKQKVDNGAATPLLIPPSPCMKKLGFGTGASVYLIERFSPKNGSYKSPWAVKKISSRLEPHHTELFKSRLIHETRILKTLSHPNIIGYRSQGKSLDGNMCLIMESGQESLNDIIEDRLEQDLGPFPLENILQVAKSLASALDYLHTEAHLLHGDLKSANILIKGDFEEVKLCDFGVTVKLNDKLVLEDKEEEYVGTECWAAPEVLRDNEISNKTDMFSYGLILWEMISLSPPHTDKIMMNKTLMDQATGEELERLEAQNEQSYQEALGTRPALPSLNVKDYQTVIEIFTMCTEQDPPTRPSAKQILECYFT